MNTVMYYMSLELEPVPVLKLSPEWIEAHEIKIQKLRIKYPWSDKLANKIGLNSIYISDTIADIMHLRAEKEAELQLNCSNPAFEKFIGLHNTLMKAHKEQGDVFSPYVALLRYVESYTGQKIRPTRWSNYIPDIRALDTLEECFSWLYMYLGGDFGFLRRAKDLT
jgi:hypothetical protein